MRVNDQMKPFVAPIFKSPKTVQYPILIPGEAKKAAPFGAVFLSGCGAGSMQPPRPQRMRSAVQAPCARMGLRPRAVEVGVFGALRHRLVARRIGKRIRSLGVCRHDIHSLK